MDKINIAEILNDKPRGTKLYTPMSGDVWLVKTEKDEFTDNYPITVSRSEDDGVNALNTLAFTAHGQYMNTGECLLFPSKNMRDWEKFAWERGDVLTSNGKGVCMFDGWLKDDYTQFKAAYSVSVDTSGKENFCKGEIFNTEDFYKASASGQRDVIANLEKEYKGKFNPETLEIEKPTSPFKDGDVVYVETKEGYQIVSVVKEFTEEMNPVVYFEYFLDEERVCIADKFDGYNLLCDWKEIMVIRLATEEEKELLFSKLKELGKKWNADTKRIENLPHRFKPFDKVLVRNNNKNTWQIALFSHIVNRRGVDFPYRVIGINSYYWMQCIPYEGNEELVGTSNEPKK